MLVHRGVQLADGRGLPAHRPCGRTCHERRRRVALSYPLLDHHRVDDGREPRDSAHVEVDGDANLCAVRDGDREGHTGPRRRQGKRRPIPMRAVVQRDAPVGGSAALNVHRHEVYARLNPHVPAGQVVGRAQHQEAVGAAPGQVTKTGIGLRYRYPLPRHTAAHRRGWQRGRSQPAVVIRQQIGTAAPNPADGALELSDCLPLRTQGVALLGHGSLQALQCAVVCLARYGIVQLGDG
ncbi:hypothetical protein D3C79_733460 [compost metagenome]